MSYTKNFYFDIETVPVVETFEELPNAEFEALCYKNERLLKAPHIVLSGDRKKDIATLKKTKLVIQDQETTLFSKIQEFWEKESSFYPQYSMVASVCIGIFTHDDSTNEKAEQILVKAVPCIDDKGDFSEEVLLRKTVATFNKISSYSSKLSACGWNIKGFDIPFLHGRLFKHGIRIPDCISTFRKKPWEVPFEELSEIFPGKSFTSLIEACSMAGVQSPKDEIDGSMVKDAFYKKQYDKIHEYCIKDVHSTMELAKKIYTFYFDDFNL